MHLASTTNSLGVEDASIYATDPSPFVLYRPLQATNDLV